MGHLIGLVNLTGVGRTLIVTMEVGGMAEQQFKHDRSNCWSQPHDNDICSNADSKPIAAIENLLRPAGVPGVDSKLLPDATRVVVWIFHQHLV
jgi:hypothetical protein